VIVIVLPSDYLTIARAVDKKGGYKTEMPVLMMLSRLQGVYFVVSPKNYLVRSLLNNI
jgi:hypothetical protein